MLKGLFLVRVDNKGRIVLPAKLRRYLNNSVVIVRDSEKCLLVFPKEHSSSFQTTQKLKIDRDGRVMIPVSLRKLTGFQRESEAVIVGKNDHFQVWSRETWEEKTNNTAEKIVIQRLEKIVEELKVYIREYVEQRLQHLENRGK